MVREPGVGPGRHAWQARIIPLDHSRMVILSIKLAFLSISDHYCCSIHP